MFMTKSVETGEHIMFHYLHPVHQNFALNKVPSKSQKVILDGFNLVII